MRLLPAFPLLLLAACAATEPPPPLTPEQRAAAIQMLMNRPPIQMPQVQQPAPIQLPQQTSCTSMPMGGGTYQTVCR